MANLKNKTVPSITEYDHRVSGKWKGLFQKTDLPVHAETPYENVTFLDDVKYLQEVNSLAKRYRWVYVGLEAYESRYTLQLTEWNKAVFKALPDVKVEFLDQLAVFNVVKEVNNIQVGEVLDATSRAKHATAQILRLIEMVDRGQIDNDTILLFEDMYHPGLDALFYYLSQSTSNKRPLIYLRCLAQTIDPDDFVYRTHGPRMANWMRHYERMVLNGPGVRGIVAASTEMLANMRVAGWDAERTDQNYIVSGLPFGKAEVQSWIDPEDRKHFSERPLRVTFASRIATEKQPWFFVAVAQAFRRMYGLKKDQIQFCFVSGVAVNQETVDTEVWNVVENAVDEGHCTLYQNLSKQDYYNILNDTRVLFNCSLQDWVSNTVSEADALGCNLLFPAYRSFPEVFENDHTRLYTPWSVTDACEKLIKLLALAHPLQGRISSIQDKSILNTIYQIAKCELCIGDDPEDFAGTQGTSHYLDAIPAEYRQFTLYDERSDMNVRRINSDWVTTSQAEDILYMTLTQTTDMFD